MRKWYCVLVFGLALVLGLAVGAMEVAEAAPPAPPARVAWETVEPLPEILVAKEVDHPVAGEVVTAEATEPSDSTDVVECTSTQIAAGCDLCLIKGRGEREATGICYAFKAVWRGKFQFAEWESIFFSDLLPDPTDPDRDLKACGPSVTVVSGVKLVDGCYDTTAMGNWGSPIPAGCNRGVQPPSIVVHAVADDTGYVFSREMLENHFGSAAMWTGFAPSGADRGKYYGAVQFDLGEIPTEAEILSAQVELASWSGNYLNSSANGSWTLNLLESDVDLGWQGKTYWDIAVLADVEDTIGSALSYDDLGGLNTFAFSEEQLDALEERLGTTSKVSFRLDYEAERPFWKDIYGWDGGAPPVLRVTYYVEP